MKKIMISWISALVGVSLCSMPASANETVTPAQQQAVLESANTLVEQLSSATAYSADATQQKDDLSFDVENAYSVVMMQDFFVTDFHENADFSSLLSDEIRIQLPYAQGDMTFSASGEFLGMTSWSEPVLLPEEIDGILADALPEGTVPDTVTYAYSQQYHATFVYFCVDGAEYIIPYLSISGEDLDVASTVYPLSDFMTAMYQTFDEQLIQDNYNPNEIYYGGGVPLKDQTASALMQLQPATFAPLTTTASHSVAFPVWMCLISAVAVVGGGLFCFRRWQVRLSVS